MNLLNVTLRQHVAYTGYSVQVYLDSVQIWCANVLIAFKLRVGVFTMPTCSIIRIKGFVLEQVLRAIRPSEAYFWATHNGAEIDLFFQHRGRRYAVEVKFSEAPTITRSMRIALEDLALDHLWIVYPGPHTYPVHDKITVWSFQKLADLPSQI